MLYAAVKEREAAEASMRVALGAAEPMNAMRLFTFHDAATTLEFLHGMHHPHRPRDG